MSRHCVVTMNPIERSESMKLKDEVDINWAILLFENSKMNETNK